jgi:hypothetical protein
VRGTDSSFAIKLNRNKGADARRKNGNNKKVIVDWCDKQ